MDQNKPIGMDASGLWSGSGSAVCGCLLSVLGSGRGCVHKMVFCVCVLWMVDVEEVWDSIMEDFVDVMKF